jgi:uncharacterized protein (DUF305 family)
VEPNAVDIGFNQDMIQHHQQAVTMAQIVGGRADPQINNLAMAIAADQLREIGQMQGYLDLWAQPLLPSSPVMSWMGDHEQQPMSSHGHTMPGMGTTPAPAVAASMPGMATQAELTQLQQASGEQLDVLFLQLMLRHHQGAVPMAEYAADHVAVPQVKSFAQRIAFGQTEEIQRLTTLLGQHGAMPLAPPPPMN